MTLRHPISRPLLDPEPPGDKGGGGTPPPDWKAALPKELAEDPTIAVIPDVPTLAKNLIEKQKFIGLKRVEAPSKDWDEAKWGAWHELGGKPKTKDDYAMPKVELPEGMSADEPRLKAAAEQAHKLGLSQSQFEGLTKWFLEGEAGAFKAASTQASLDRETSVKALKDAWRGDFDKNIDIAKSALQKYGSEDLFKFLDQHKLGNHPEMVKVFHKIGLELLEDSAKGKGPGLDLNGATAAKLEMDQLRTDKNFTDALYNRDNLGHKAAVERWTLLNKRAFAGG